MTDDDLEEKLARIGARVAARSESTRERLAAMHNGFESALQVADDLRERINWTC